MMTILASHVHMSSISHHHAAASLRRRKRARASVTFMLASLAGVGCARVPSPLAPSVAGSVGMPHLGVLTDAEELASEGKGWKLLRDNQRGFGLPRFVHALERVAEAVATARPGGTLVVGDLSARNGGAIMPHFSHRNGRDADLVFFAMTLDGIPIASPGFVHYGADGLAWDSDERRFLRLDVEREWLLVKTLLEDNDARVQWLFVSRPVEAMLLEWASAKDEPAETLMRAQTVMAQPHPGGEHDDHLHVRTACSEDEMAHGCETSGPVRAWLAPEPLLPLDTRAVGELVLALLRTIDDDPDPHHETPARAPNRIPIALR
jgi:penicillin-insensitive murein DD-endopeptidase